MINIRVHLLASAHQKIYYRYHFESYLIPNLQITIGDGQLYLLPFIYLGPTLR